MPRVTQTRPKVATELSYHHDHGRCEDKADSTAATMLRLGERNRAQIKALDRVDYTNSEDR